MKVSFEDPFLRGAFEQSKCENVPFELGQVIKLLLIHDCPVAPHGLPVL